MQIDVSDFKGEAPKLAPRLLPNDMAQATSSPRLISGNLEAWGGFLNGQAGQAITSAPVTIWYMDDTLWLSWNQPSSSAPVPGGAERIWLTSEATPFYDTGMSSSGSGTVFWDPTSLIPNIIGMTTGTITVVDYTTNASYTYASGVAPPGAPAGDGYAYSIATSNGALGTPTPLTSPQAAYWGSIWRNGGNVGTVGYPGPGNTCGIPYGRTIVMYTSHSLLVVTGQNYFGTLNKIIGGVSDSNSINGAVLFAMVPTTDKAVFDIIPALSGSPVYLIGCFPCADLAHLLVLTSATSSSAADKWHIVSLSATAATEVTAGPWTTGPEVSGGNCGSGNSSMAQQNYSWQSAYAPMFGMLESDLQHFWMADVQQDFFLISLVSGTADAVLFTGSNSSNPPFFFISPVTFGETGYPPMALWADQGACGLVLGNWAAYWVRQIQTASTVEIDVAKEAIAGDTSWRTIFCGEDCPRFTDLGLASGLVDGSGHPVTGSSTVAANPGPYPIFSRKLGVPNPTTPANASTAPAAAGSSNAGITETFDAPVDWNLANVPGFAITSFGISGGYPSGAGGVMKTRGIGFIESFGYKTQAIDNTQPLTMTVEFSYQRAAYDYLMFSYVDFFFTLDGGGSGSVVRVNTSAVPLGIYVQWCPVNSGVIGTPITSTFVGSGSITSWHTDSDPNWTGPFVAGHWYTASLAVTPQTPTSTSQAVLTIKDGSTTIFAAQTSPTTMPNAGAGFGMGCTQVAGMSFPDWAEVWFDNLALAGVLPAAPTSSTIATSYLYTLVNDLGEESGPSNAMVTPISSLAGSAICVQLPTGTDAASFLAAAGADSSYFKVGPGYGAAFAASGYIPTVQATVGSNPGGPSPSMRLYRAVTGSSGTQFLLVAADIPFGQIKQVGPPPSVALANPPSTFVAPPGFTAGIVDALPDSALSEVMPSLLWSPPPTNMLGIKALPNGIYAGFSGNNLTLTPQGIPHAWPIEYQLTFDYPIVGLENIDATVVALTQNYPYLCAGNTPDSFSQTKATYPYACASKRSVKYLKGLGVVFASFEGLVAIAAPGQEKVLTENLFSKRDWTALNPASMIAEVNDGRYFCSYTTLLGAPGGFYIDVMQQGAGKVSMDFHFTARYNDPLTDIFYMIRDGIGGYPTIEGFDEDQSNVLPYTWKSKRFPVPYPMTPRMARVWADSYVSVVLTLFADGTQYAAITVTSQTEFVIPEPANGTASQFIEFQIASTDKVNRVQLVESSDELT